MVWGGGGVGGESNVTTGVVNPLATGLCVTQATEQLVNIIYQGNQYTPHFPALLILFTKK